MELAEQYAAMDAASNKARRRVLADHLREVIDQLERKGDQIAGLYEILEVKAAGA
jgi:DNA-binding FrmR family transcriptional regulator